MVTRMYTVSELGARPGVFVVQGFTSVPGWPRIADREPEVRTSLERARDCIPPSFACVHHVTLGGRVLEAWV